MLQKSKPFESKKNSGESLRRLLSPPLAGGDKGEGEGSFRLPDRPTEGIGYGSCALCFMSAPSERKIGLIDGFQ